MDFNQVRFTAAYGTAEQLPASRRPEVSFVGRSNVGKSSLLNKIFNRKSLAKVSQTPGKTATINFFEAVDIDFVDLPGYGYSKTGKADRNRWAELVGGYFSQERMFALVVSLIDIRHAATDLDEQMIKYLMVCDLPFMIVFTKADKLSKMQQQKQISALRKQLQCPAETPMIACSSANGSGMEDVRKAITAALYE